MKIAAWSEDLAEWYGSRAFIMPKPRLEIMNADMRAAIGYQGVLDISVHTTSATIELRAGVDTAGRFVKDG